MQNKHLNSKEAPINNSKNLTLFDKITAPLWELIENPDYLPAHDSAKKLHFKAFIRLLLYYYLNRLDSLRSLKTDLEDSQIVSTAGLIYCGLSTIHDAFARYKSFLFERLYKALLLKLPMPPIKEFQELGCLTIVDSSAFSMAINVYWASFKEHSNALKMHLCLSLNQMMTACFLITPAKCDDRVAFRKLIEEGITYIADRGYLDLKLFAEIIKQKAHFVIRIRKNLKYELQQALPVQLIESVKLIFFNVTDEIVRFDCDSYNKLYRRISFRTHTSLFILVTDRLDLTTFEVIKLYCLRWQVELFFRYIKCTIGTLHLINTSIQGATTQFYMVLIVHLLLVVFKHQQFQQYLTDKNEFYLAKSQRHNKYLIRCCYRWLYHSTAEFVAAVGGSIPDIYKIKKQEWRKIRNELFRTNYQLCFNFP